MLNKLLIALAAGLFASAALAGSSIPSDGQNYLYHLTGTPANQGMAVKNVKAPSDGQNHFYHLKAEMPAFQGTAAREWSKGESPFPVTPESLD